MRRVLIQVNTSFLRPKPCDGIICTSMWLPVTVTDKPPVDHNGHKLLTVLDANGTEHLIDSWYVETADPD